MTVQAAGEPISATLGGQEGEFQRMVCDHEGDLESTTDRRERWVQYHCKQCHAIATLMPGTILDMAPTMWFVQVDGDRGTGRA